MRPRDVNRGAALSAALREFSANVRELPGVSSPKALTSLTEQIVESIRRIEYIRLIHGKKLRQARANPNSPIFDPIMAASLQARAGNLEEACWLVFLSVHFGKNGAVGWQLTRLVYGGVADGIWTWSRVTDEVDKFPKWLEKNRDALKPGGVVRFGNHRKYESLEGGSNGTGSVIQSYVRWINQTGSHKDIFDNALKSGDGPFGAFDLLYRGLNAVRRFGRTAKFDYLTMLAKLELAEVDARIPYLDGATGPLKGARLLFGGDRNSDIAYSALDELVSELGAHLGVNMQIMEDSLCNWQKSPSSFLPFRG